MKGWFLINEPPEGSGPPCKRPQKPRKDYRKGTCTNSSCDSWHPPVCQSYETQAGCRFGERCSFLRRESDCQPNTRTKTGGGEGLFSLNEQRQKVGFCISGRRAAESEINIAEGPLAIQSACTVHTRPIASTLNWHVSSCVKAVSMRLTTFAISLATPQGVASLAALGITMPL